MATDTLENAPAVAVDFETFYGKDCDIKSLGQWHYLNDPRCEIYLMGIAGDGISWAGNPKDFDWSLLDGKFIVAHNLSFDGLVMAKLAHRETWPVLPASCLASMSPKT